MDGNGLRLVRLLGDDLILPAMPILGLDSFELFATTPSFTNPLGYGFCGNLSLRMG